MPAQKYTEHAFILQYCIGLNGTYDPCIVEKVGFSNIRKFGFDQRGTWIMIKQLPFFCKG